MSGTHGIQHRERSGTEPRTARSDIPARRALAAFFAVLFACGMAAFAVFAAIQPHVTALLVAGAALCAISLAIAGADLRHLNRIPPRHRGHHGHQRQHQH